MKVTIKTIIHNFHNRMFRQNSSVARAAVAAPNNRLHSDQNTHSSRNNGEYSLQPELFYWLKKAVLLFLL